MITIKGVYLKNGAGKWVKIIEPDRRVDLSIEEPVVTFFNNSGRVPAGSYQNFRVDFFDEDLNHTRRLCAKSDFVQGVAVKKGSFIHVSFGLDLDRKISVEKAQLTVDEDSREFLSGSLLLEAV